MIKPSPEPDELDKVAVPQATTDHIAAIEASDEQPAAAEIALNNLDPLRNLLKIYGRKLRESQTEPDKVFDELERRRISGEVTNARRTQKNIGENGKIIYFNPSQQLVDTFKEMYPEIALPDIKALTAHALRIETLYAEITEIEGLVISKSLNPEQRVALSNGAHEIFAEDSFKEANKYLLGLYVRILLYFNTVSGSIESKVINPATLELNKKVMEELIDVIHMMQDAYPVIARRIMVTSDAMTLLMIDRYDTIREQAKEGNEPKRSDFQRNTRAAADSALVSATNALNGAKAYNSKFVADNLTTALETGLFATTHFAADNLAPAFVKGEDGKFAFEKYFPFKLDFILAANSCIMTLMPQLRYVLSIMSRIDIVTNGMTQKYEAPSKKQ